MFKTLVDAFKIKDVRNKLLLTLLLLLVFRLGCWIPVPGLEEITFQSTPTSIANNAFGACTNLKTINVPWANGAVANAPWGATIATINYDYTGE